MGPCELLGDRGPRLAERPAAANVIDLKRPAVNPPHPAMPSTWGVVVRRALSQKPPFFETSAGSTVDSLVHRYKKAGFSEEPRHPSIYLLDTRWQQMHNAMRVRESRGTDHRELKPVVFMCTHKGIVFCRNIRRNIQRYWILRRICRSISC